MDNFGPIRTKEFGAQALLRPYQTPHSLRPTLRTQQTSPPQRRGMTSSVAPRRNRSEEAAVKLSSCVMCLLPEHPSTATGALRVLTEVKKDLAEIQFDDIDVVDRAPLDQLLADIQAQAARLAAAL
jgi:hypothetical protein